jgi:hypothetical protein
MAVIIVEMKLYQVAGGFIIEPFTGQCFTKWRRYKITVHFSLFGNEEPVTIPFGKEPGGPF